MTEFSLLVHVSTNLQHRDAFLHPHVCTLSPCGALAAFLGSSAYLTVCVAWQGSCERSLHISSGPLPGPQRAPSPWREEGARTREDLGVGGVLGGGERWGGDDDKGCIIAGGEQIVHIITLSSGMEREGAEQRSDNNEKQRRIEWRCS